MPWRASEASEFTKKAKSKKAKRQWKDVANSVLKRGGSEGSAVRQANGVIKKRKQRMKRMEDRDEAV